MMMMMKGTRMTKTIMIMIRMMTTMTNDWKRRMKKIMISKMMIEMQKNDDQNEDNGDEEKEDEEDNDT